MRERRDRAYGPYKHRDVWRVVLIGADGSRTTATYESRKEAEKRVADYNAAESGRTVSGAIDQFLAESTMKYRSQKTIAYRLRGITGNGDRLLRKLTPRVARDLFAERAKETSGDTQFHELASVRAFFMWCTRKGWAAANPFEGLKPTKRRNRGKPQLRIDETRKLLDACIAEDSMMSTAVALALLCGMRASSVTDRLVRDLDDDARVLWIENDKTKAGDRRLELPAVIRGPLRALAAGKNGSDRLFPGTNRDWLRYHTQRLCKKAGVPVITSHGLRGTHSSLARQEVPADHVARVLGHAGPAITRSNYFAPGVESAIDQRTVLSVIDGGRGKVGADRFHAQAK